MRNRIAVLALIALLSGCVVPAEPAPYYGGSAPYYGTAYVPAYIGVYGGGYYPYYGYQHIHSGYNNGYWHARNGGSHWGGGHPGGGGRPAGGGHPGGGGQAGGGHH